MIKHYCRHTTGKLKAKAEFPIIVKVPKGLLEKESPSCPACGKLFKNLKNFNDHINNLRKRDDLHQDFYKNKLNFKLGHRDKSQANSDKYNLYYNNQSEA